MNAAAFVAAAFIAAAFIAACREELEAPKPGNVHVFAAGHGMDIADFLASADAAAPFIAEPRASVGGRIEAAVAATWKTVGKNTNLGIVLLCAPLAAAAPTGDLQAGVAKILAGLDRQDANLAFAAIRRAAPAGLGRSAVHDVHAEADCTLLQAMQAASASDRIAWNYANGFHDIFGPGLQILRQARLAHAPAWWPTLRVYMHYLAAFPDSHVARKFGLLRAQEVQARAALLSKPLAVGTEAAALLPSLLALDADLKKAGLNPGTSADLTVATLFAERLIAHRQSS